MSKRMCLNFVVCENETFYNEKYCFDCATMRTLDDWVLDIKHVGENECPVCLDRRMCVNQPRCDKHPICVECFKRCHYGNEIDSLTEPEYPYPDDENGFVCPENFRTDPKIIEYLQKYEEWETNQGLADENEEANLKKCPICRI